MLDQEWVFDNLPLSETQKQELLKELIKARSDAAVADKMTELPVEPAE
jgi:hypothetical protein